MATYQDVVAAAKAASGRTDSLIAAFAATKARVEELLAAQGTVSAEVQAGLDEIFDIETSDAAKLDAAIGPPV
jgi:hypothetical protein